MRLTKREAQILAMVGKGLTVKEIAYRLDCGQQTIKNHMYRMHRALDCTTTAGALIKCLKAGIITLEDC
jgi:DNA-binding NarL/FixJ family response regulator